MSNPIQIQKHLSGIDYPVGKDQLVAKAEENGAGDDVLSQLRGLPDRQYNGPNAVSEELSRS
ncbi:DUF2795 domain-containing protein [Lentzea sp. NBRC 105346]|uniref:DUF2795 domain-containing protein n=1 Tax=Lentzea sp. NBRC 105346 TaxID=3032205 RepID=UPI0025556A69|nr:DUF2795 domain-containing protein [Lentzea sp. NBRC 105346]